MIGKGNRGHSTKSVNRHLKSKKYVTKFNNPKSKKKFRVVIKVDNKVKTIGYFEHLYEAEAIAQCLRE